jgi:putative membrane protein
MSASITAAAAGVAVALLLSATAYAADDSAFLEKAIQTNLAEISVGQLAQQKGASQSVKDFGGMLIKDHTASNQDATALANAHGVNVPTGPAAKDKATYDKLSAMSGPKFDSAFAQAMVAGHKEAIALFTDQAKTQDDVGAFAAKTLPTLQEHLQTAQQIAASAGTASAAPTENSAQASNPPAANNAAAPGADAMATDNSATAKAATAGTLVEPATVSAEDLKDATLYGAANDDIADVGDIIITKDGKIDAVVLDVGGFLGIGTKEVAVAFEDLQFRRDSDNRLSIYTHFTREQLEQAPTYDKDQYPQQRDNMRVRSAAQ